MPKSRRTIVLLLLAAGASGCSPAAPTNSITPPAPPPAPPPVPLVLTVNPLSRKATAQPGTPAPGDNATVTLAGDGATNATWTATKRQAWTTLTTASGTGSGPVAWTRNMAGLVPGTYVDTITIAAPGATGSPVTLLDSLVVTTAPVPLVLMVSPRSRSATIIQGAAAPDDNAAITLTGDSAATTRWSAGGAHSWTTFGTANGSGSGSVTWHRNSAGLAVGTYVDTLTITANGASGSPTSVIDTLKVLAIPVPLTLALSPASRSVSVIQGASAAGSSATVTLAGDNSSTTAWSATKRKAWTTLTAASGTGSGTVGWSRSTAALAAGTYVDTIAVAAAGASGSPATVIDTVVVTAAAGGPTPDLGPMADMHGKQVFLATDLWNRPVDTAQVDPNSLAILSQIGLGVNLHPDFGANWNGGPFGIPYIVVPDSTPRYTVPFDYASQSDPGPYPIPANPPIEDGGDPSSDSHLIVITQHEWKLYEMFYVQPQGAGWTAGSGAIFDLTTNTTRPAGWTSADAAGLPIFPGLVRYDEVYLRGAINHALRFTVQHTRAAYVAPASHVASSSTDTLNPPMGMRVRLKASFDMSGYPAPCQVILRALQKYGMIVADNGSNFFISGTPDARWDDNVNNLLKQVHVSDFEVVRMTGVVVP